MVHLDSSNLRRARDVLQTRGMRATDQRVAVLAALMGQSGDATPQALHERLRAEQPSIGLATVYRTLATLAAEGVVDALQHGHGTSYRWCAPGHHHHLTCDVCHRVVEVRDCGVGEWAQQVAGEHGFAGVRHVVELTGTCSNCQSA